MERRLAAILVADVVGYSHHMGEDEAGTVQRLKVLREGLIEPLIAKHNGRVVKLMGDGILAAFNSVVDAVQCAVAWQLGMAERGADELSFRIGINLGDVIVEGGDVYGDGVNVAARLEALAEPGDIYVSGTVYDHVAKKVDFDFEDLGPKSVKNIVEPVVVYRVALDGGPQESELAESKELGLPEKPSIAVLPFDNMSDDPEQDYLADGITEDLITALSKIRWFFIIARNSTFTYKGQAVDVTRVAQELGVRYVLEGSVRRAAGRVRVTAQLIDAGTGNHVWAERYDREMEDIFALQDEMTQTIVGAVEPELGAAERARVSRKPPGNLDAWETYQRGLWHLWVFSKEDNAKAQTLLRRAQELDPSFATAFAFESYSHYLDAILGYAETPKESIAAAYESATEALAMDDKDPVAYFALGRVYMLRGEHDASIEALESSLSINPSFAQAHHGLGFALALAGRVDEAAAELDKSIRFSPRDPLLFAIESIRALVCVLQGDDESGAAWAEKAIRHPKSAGGGYWPHAVLAAALANRGRIDDAAAALERALARKPDLSLTYLKETLPTKNEGGLDPYLDGLRKAGLPD